MNPDELPPPPVFRGDEAAEIPPTASAVLAVVHNAAGQEVRSWRLHLGARLFASTRRSSASMRLWSIIRDAEADRFAGGITIAKKMHTTGSRMSAVVLIAGNSSMWSQPCCC